MRARSSVPFLAWSFMVVASYACATSPTDGTSGTGGGTTGGTTSGSTSGTSTTGGSTTTGGATTAGGGTTGGSSGSFPQGQGMTMPWVELQAEDAATNATVLPASRTKWDATQIQAEAIGRRAVRLDKTGDYVEFTSTAAFNSLVLRFCIPDSTDGTGLNATLGLYINGQRVKDMNLTSHYAWSYNGEYIPSTATDTAGAAGLNDPTKPLPHTFFDEYNTGPGDVAGPLLGDLPAGTTIRLQRDAQDTAAYYILDLIDLEQVAPAPTMPAGFTSIVTASNGAINPNDGIDHADDLERVLLASGSTTKLWFPPGEYIVRKYVTYSANAALDNMGTEISGAGMWYTRILGKQALFFCDVMAPCSVHDLAIFGDSIARDEPVNGAQKAFGGPQGVGTQLYNLWIEHTVAGIWVGGDPPYQTSPTQSIHIHDVRIRNTFADGINLDNGTSLSLVENSHMRNTGDDSATVWSVKWTEWALQNPGAVKANALNAPDQGIAHGNHFDHISVQMPWRADCFAAYGGYDNWWENSTCEDVLTYPGIFVDNEFGPYPFGSQSVPAPAAPFVTTFNNITLLRAGGQMFFEPQDPYCNNGACTLTPWDHGAIQLSMREGNVNDVLISNINVVDSTYAGIELRGMTSAVMSQYGITSNDPNMASKADSATFSNVTLQNVTVSGSGTYGVVALDLDTGSRGTVNFDTVQVSTSVAGASQMNNAPATLITKVGSGNSGF